MANATLREAAYGALTYLDAWIDGSEAMRRCFLEHLEFVTPSGFFPSRWDIISEFDYWYATDWERRYE